MDQETAARVRRAHTIRIWAGSIVLVIGLVYAFGNPLWGGRNTPLEIVVGLLMVAAGAANIILSVVGLRKLSRH
jgi:drug/metabolite transporter (DMT)-like permease